jgi:hypothetical protein
MSMHVAGMSHSSVYPISVRALQKGGGPTQNGQQVSKTSHLSGEGDLQVSLCSVYPFSRFIQSSVAEAYLVFPYSLPSRGAPKSLRSATDRGVFRSMLEFQVTGDGAWFLHARFAG